MIYIYDDGHHSTAYIHSAIVNIGYKDISFCSASMIVNNCLKNAKILIMPGGADLYFCEKLNGIGNQKIRDFVSNGGSFLGICAGAYYACAELDWACSEIAGKRELSFHNGMATGPVYEWIENKESIYDGSWIKAVEIETEDGQQFLTQYNGGPVFKETGDTAIARYRELNGNPPAITGGNFGKGKYVLSSPHIECFGNILSDRLYKHLNKSYNREKAETDKLLEHEKEQKEFFKSIIERLI